MLPSSCTGSEDTGHSTNVAQCLGGRACCLSVGCEPALPAARGVLVSDLHRASREPARNGATGRAGPSNEGRSEMKSSLAVLPGVLSFPVCTRAHSTGKQGADSTSGSCTESHSAAALGARLALSRREVSADAGALPFTPVLERAGHQSTERATEHARIHTGSAAPAILFSPGLYSCPSGDDSKVPNHEWPAHIA